MAKRKPLEASPRPWRHDLCRGCSAIVALNGHLVVGSQIMRADKQDIVDHELIVRAVNMMKEV